MKKVTQLALAGALALGFSSITAYAGESARIVSYSHGTPRHYGQTQDEGVTVALYTGDRRVTTMGMTETDTGPQQQLQAQGRAGYRLVRTD